MSSPTTRPPRGKIASTCAPPTFYGAGLTHRGRVRSANEDAILTDPDRGALWVVSDGMGGYRHGDMASDIVTRQLAMIGDASEPIASLRAGLEAAHFEIQRITARPGMGRMGATAVAMLLKQALAHIVWVGDCRAYLMRQNHLKLLTRDHTVVQDLIDDGILSESEREAHPDAHVVTRAVGYDTAIEIDAVSVPVVPNDKILLCSDGLMACMGDHEIADHVAFAATPEALCADLINAALQLGAPDNVSVIAVFSNGGET
ncbi:MAG: protein phosphatase 2C domain-containing protein [Litoreibacter sp.]